MNDRGCSDGRLLLVGSGNDDEVLKRESGSIGGEVRASGDELRKVVVVSESESDPSTSTSSAIDDRILPSPYFHSAPSCSAPIHVSCPSPHASYHPSTAVHLHISHRYTSSVDLHPAVPIYRLHLASHFLPFLLLLLARRILLDERPLAVEEVVYHHYC